MAFELQLFPSSDQSGILEWKHGEIQIQLEVTPEWIAQLLQITLQLSRFRGEMSLNLSENERKLALVFRDVFNDALSYEWLDYGEGSIDLRKFKRLGCGKIDLTEFEEMVYAGITDLGVLLGSSGYEEMFSKPFPQAPYSKLAKQLGRPDHIPLEGEESFDEHHQETNNHVESDWVWESEDSDTTFESNEPPPWLRDPKELQTRDEFLILGELINKKNRK